jgi:hypothetical protein
MKYRLQIKHTANMQPYCKACLSNLAINLMSSVKKWNMSHFLLLWGNSKCPYTFPEVLCFFDLEKPGTFCIPNQILHYNRTEQFKTNKSGAVVR